MNTKIIKYILLAILALNSVILITLFLSSGISAYQSVTVLLISYQVALLFCVYLIYKSFTHSVWSYTGVLLLQTCSLLFIDGLTEYELISALVVIPTLILYGAYAIHADSASNIVPIPVHNKNYSWYSVFILCVLAIALPVYCIVQFEQHYAERIHEHMKTKISEELQALVYSPNLLDQTNAISAQYTLCIPKTYDATTETELDKQIAQQSTCMNTVAELQGAMLEKTNNRLIEALRNPELPDSVRTAFDVTETAWKSYEYSQRDLVISIMGDRMPEDKLPVIATNLALEKNRMGILHLIYDRLHSPELFVTGESEDATEKKLYADDMSANIVGGSSESKELFAQYDQDTDTMYKKCMDNAVSQSDMNDCNAAQITFWQDKIHESEQWLIDEFANDEPDSPMAINNRAWQAYYDAQNEFMSSAFDLGSGASNELLQFQIPLLQSRLLLLQTVETYVQI